MSIYTHKNKALLDVIQRRDATDYIRRILIHAKKTEWWLPVKISSLNEAEQVRDFLNGRKGSLQAAVQGLADAYYWGGQPVDFIPSNLGCEHGYVFYFRCRGCNRRVKYVYEYDATEAPVCRLCCRLRYMTPSRQVRSISRLLRKPFYTDEIKRLIIEKVGITQEDCLARK